MRAFLLISFSALWSFVAAQVTYPNLIPDVWNISATAAAQRLVGSNVVVSNATFGDNGAQLAAFNQGLQALGFDEGIVITTGNAQLAGSTGDSNNSQAVSPHVPGNDPDLEILNGQALDFNEGVLEFDFITTGTNISFKYLFGSEEYVEWVGSGFNDAFGFFLSGPGIAGPFSNGAVNLAMINGLPVSVNSINSTTNSAFYFDNYYIPHIGVPTVEGVNTQLEYDGFTWGLTASHAVRCNQVYHMKLAICNSGDAAFDSGVFIERAALTSTISPPGPLTISPSPVCAGEPITLTVGGDPNWFYTWSIPDQSGFGLQEITTNASLDLNSYSVSAEYAPGCSLSTASLAQSLVVHNPVNTPPTCLGVNGTGATQFTIQAGEQGCFTIPTSDSPNEPVGILRTGGDVGGSFTVNSSFQQVGSYCWTPSASDLGFHNLIVTATDENVCDQLSSTCTFDVKVVCEFCPIRVYYEWRGPYYEVVGSVRTGSDQMYVSVDGVF